MVITPDSFFYSNAKAYTYTNLTAVGFHLPLSLFGFLSNQIPINYLFTIILKDYSNKIRSKSWKFIFKWIPRGKFLLDGGLGIKPYTFSKTL